MVHFLSWKIKIFDRKKNKKRAHLSITNAEQLQSFKISIEMIRNQIEDSSLTEEKLFIDIVCELSASRQCMIMHMS